MRPPPPLDAIQTIRITNASLDAEPWTQQLWYIELNGIYSRSGELNGKPMWRNIQNLGHRHTGGLGPAAFELCWAEPDWKTTKKSRIVRQKNYHHLQGADYKKRDALVVEDQVHIPTTQKFFPLHPVPLLKRFLDPSLVQGRVFSQEMPLLATGIAEC